MKYELFIQDAAGNKNNSIGNISFLAFLKHATFAGIDRHFFLRLPFRYLGLFFEFIPSFFWSDCFQLLPELINDPTEKAYVSNKIGRAFADYFSKEKYGATFTFSYECAMARKGISISGKRPDFYCSNISKKFAFAVEAKGYLSHSVSDKAMARHKTQSQTGPLSVDFTVASVAYNLYKSPKIKLYDPEGGRMPYDDTLNSLLRESYYRSVLHFVGLVSDERTQSEFSDYFSYNVSYPFLGIRRILLHKAIYEENWNNVEWLTSLERKDSEDEEYYLDVDGIGLANRSIRTR